MIFEYTCRIDGENNILKIIIITPKLDSANSANLECALIKLAEFNNIVMDLKNVEYLSSMGIGAMLNIYKTAIRYGNNLKITNVSDTIKKVIEITKIPYSFV